MRFRKLRIAWSVVCAIACVLLIALWVRSYRYQDGVMYNPSPYNSYSVSSAIGAVRIGYHMQSGYDLKQEYGTWKILNYAVDENTETGWGFKRSAWADWNLSIPIFVVLTLVATLGLILLQRWSFSLRTLLIATTLVAVVLGLSRLA
jgi:hypothetical protein